MNGNYQLVDLRKETESESGTEANKEIYVSLKRAADRGIGVLCLAEAGNFFSSVEKAEDGTVGVSVVKATATTSDSDTVWTATAETHTFTAQGVCNIDSVAIVTAPEPEPAAPEFPEVGFDTGATEQEDIDTIIDLLGDVAPSEAGVQLAVKFSDSSVDYEGTYYAQLVKNSASSFGLSYLRGNSIIVHAITTSGITTTTHTVAADV